MNWLKAIKLLLGRFWADIFKNSDFLLGVEYLMFVYSKLTQNQYLNWRNGLIAANDVVEQSNLPFVVYIAVPDNGAEFEREWYGWTKLWDAGSGGLFANSQYSPTEDKDDMGWITYSRFNIPIPDYMQDHLYHYSKILVRGLDYDFSDGKFVFYTDPAALSLPKIKVTDADGNLHVYYRVFGSALQTQKVCDPVTGFESQWLNSSAEVAWDIHTNGATYYNTKKLLGQAIGAVICEDDGVVETAWTEQDWYCVSIKGKAYMSKSPANVEVGDSVVVGTVLFGSMSMFNGSDTPSSSEVPGINVMTDAGKLTAMNASQNARMSSGMFILPLIGDAAKVQAYTDTCTANIEAGAPYIQVPTPVNPYQFVTQTLRRGRAVTIRLVAKSLDYLAAAIKCIRKSCCASGIVNIYVATETDPDNVGTLVLSEFSADAGMMAVSVIETVKIQEACAEAKVLL